jgi:hypothetical protein
MKDIPNYASGMVLLTSSILSYNPRCSNLRPISKHYPGIQLQVLNKPTKLNHQEDIQYLAKFGTRHLWNILSHVSG